MSDSDSNSSPLSYSDMYNYDAYNMSEEEDVTSTVADNENTKSAGVHYGFDDEDALDFGGAAYNIPYMHDQSSVATGPGQERVSSSSSVSSMPSDQGRRPSSLLGGSDDNSVISASPSLDSYGFSAVESVAGSASGSAFPPKHIHGNTNPTSYHSSSVSIDSYGYSGSVTGAVHPPKQIHGSANPTPYHNATPSVTGSMSTNPYYESAGDEDDASVEMSLVTPEPSTPGRKNPFGKSNSSLQETVKIQYVPAAAKPPSILSKTNRQSSATSYPDHPDDEFGVSIVSSLQDDVSVQSSVKIAYVPSRFQDASSGTPQSMTPTSPLTPVFPGDYPHQQKILPANVPMAPLPHGQMIDPSIPRPDDSDSESGGINHHSQYPSQPFGGPTCSSSEASESRSSDQQHQQYQDEFLEKNQKKVSRGARDGSISVSSSVATEVPTKPKLTVRANPFTSVASEDPEAAVNVDDQDDKNTSKEKKKKSCLRRCLCIFIPALLLVLTGGGYYAYTEDFFGFDFFGLYTPKEVSNSGSSQGTNPENPQDKTPNEPAQEKDEGSSISFPRSPTPTAAPYSTDVPKGIIDNGGTNSTNSTTGDNFGSNSTNTNSTNGGNPSTGVIETKQPHLTPVDTKSPTQSPSSAVTDNRKTATPTTEAESEVAIQYRRTIQSFLESKGISFDTPESTTAVNALDRLMNDVITTRFQEEAPTNPFYQDLYRVTQRFALYCLGVALEESAQEDYATILEVAQPWTPRSEPTPMYPLVFERMSAGETKSSDHCNWFGVTCSTGDYPEIVGITWNQQELDGTIPSEISLLESITSIDLSNNYIHGTIPSELYKLPNLEKLILQHNYLEGQLNLQSSSNRLVHLDLGHNLLSGNLQPLQSVQGLRKCYHGGKYFFFLRIPSLLTVPSRLINRISQSQSKHIDWFDSRYS